jgi:hypothetical protein
MKAKGSSGRFQWNAGGWFGSQLGSTVWLFILAGEMLPKSSLVATWLGLCAAAPNILGCILRMKRDRLAPYPALQSLVGGIGAFTLLALLIADHFHVLPILDSRLMTSPRQAYWVMCIFPLLMAQFAPYGARVTESKENHGRRTRHSTECGSAASVSWLFGFMPYENFQADASIGSGGSIAGQPCASSRRRAISDCHSRGCLCRSSDTGSRGRLGREEAGFRPRSN